MARCALSGRGDGGTQRPDRAPPPPRRALRLGRAARPARVPRRRSWRIARCRRGWPSASARAWGSPTSSWERSSRRSTSSAAPPGSSATPARTSGIDLDLRQTDDPAEGWRWLRDELDAGRPTMVWADIGHLEYLRVRLRMTMHDIVVTGYDEREGVALHRRQRPRRDPALLARRAGAGAQLARVPGAQPPRHLGDGLPGPALPDPRATVEATVRGAVENMRGGGRSLGDGADRSAWPASTHSRRRFPGWPERFGERLPSALRGLRVVHRQGRHRRRAVPLAARGVPGRRGRAARRRRPGRRRRRLRRAVAGVGGRRRGERGPGPRRRPRGRGRARGRIAALERAGVEAMERWLAAVDG